MSEIYWLYISSGIFVFKRPKYSDICGPYRATEKRFPSLLKSSFVSILCFNPDSIFIFPQPSHSNRSRFSDIFFLNTLHWRHQNFLFIWWTFTAGNFTLWHFNSSITTSLFSICFSDTLILVPLFDVKYVTSPPCSDRLLRTTTFSSL